MGTEHRFTRRASFKAAFSSLTLATPIRAAGDFWNTKPQSDWSADDNARLITASPWAIATRVKMSGPAGLPSSISSASAAGSMSAQNSLNNPRITGPQGTGTPRRSIEPIRELNAAPPNTNNSSAPVAFYGEVVITWESAAPIRLARREPLGPEFDDHYAIRVNGLPAETFMPDTGKIPIVYRLLMGATLETSANKREPSDYVLRLPEKKALIFAFPRREFPLARTTGSVTFGLSLNQMTIRARFDTRQMNFLNLTAV